MPAWLRNEFVRDVATLLLVTIVTGSGLAWGIARGVDAFFGDTVGNLVGEAGEYDAILHVRSRQRDAAEAELRLILAEQLPGATFRVGPSIAGQTHYLLQLPAELHRPEVLEGLPSFFEHVPGYNGVTYMIEPSITIASVHPVRRDEIQRAAAVHEDVAFVFSNGASLIVVLRSAEAAARVTAYLDELLAAEQVLEVRFPPGVTLPPPEVMEATLVDALTATLGEGAVRMAATAPPDEDVDAFVSTLTELRGLLLEYATRVEVPGAIDRVGTRILLMPAPYGDGEAPATLVVQLEGVTEDGAAAWGYIVEGRFDPSVAAAWTAFIRQPDGSAGEVIGPARIQSVQGGLAATVAESLRLLGEWDAFAADAREGLAAVDRLIGSLLEALGELATLHGRLDVLQALLGGGASEGETRWQDVLVPFLLSEWLARENEARAAALPEPSPGPDGLEIASVKEALQRVAERVDALAALDVSPLVRQLEQVQRLLPHLDDGEIARSVQLIDRNLDGSTIAGERIELIVPSGIDSDEARRAVQRALGSDAVHVLTVASGMVTPNARSALMQVLGGVRGVIAACVAIVVVLLTLLLDHSALFSFWQSQASRHGRAARRAIRTSWAVGALDGALLLTVIAFLSGARLPYVGPAGFPAIGCALGWLTAVFATRVNPVKQEEVVAGEAMGLSFATLMREIVIPEARPGLLLWLNRRRQRFA